MIIDMFTPQGQDGADCDPSITDDDALHQSHAGEMPGTKAERIDHGEFALQTHDLRH